MRTIILLFSILFTSLFTFSQPTVEWSKCYGGSSNDYGYYIQSLDTNVYVISGETWSDDGDVSENHGLSDIWMHKIDSIGGFHCQKCLGGSDEDFAKAVRETSDKGLIICGTTLSNDGDVSGNHGLQDFWIVKLNMFGEIDWQNCLGGSESDVSQSILQTQNGEYVVAGITNSVDGDVTNSFGEDDFWVLKLNGSGELIWQKCFGGSSEDRAYSVNETSDGGYIIAGESHSIDGDVSGNHGGGDIWVIKLDSNGVKQWAHCYGGTEDEFAYSIKQVSDGGYIVAGGTMSNDGNVTTNHGSVDCWIIKLESEGNLQWQKCYGGSDEDLAYSVETTTDGGYIFSGYTESDDGDVNGNHGSRDGWIVKIDGSGVLLWQRCIGGSADDETACVQKTFDLGYVVAGYTNSNDGNVSGNHGYNDTWIVKLNETTTDIEENSFNSKRAYVYPNPFTQNTTIEFNNAHHKEYSLIIWNTSGKIVRIINNITTEKIEISKESLPSGQYIFEIKGEKIFRNKIIIH